MKNDEVEVGMLLEGWGLVLEVWPKGKPMRDGLAPLDTWRMLYMDSNDSWDGACVMSAHDDATWEEVAPRGSSEWHEAVDEILKARKAGVKAGTEEVAQITALVDQWSAGPPPMPLISELPEGGNG